MQKAIYIFVCLLVGQISIAQNAVIKGSIVDDISTPVEFANVMLLHSVDSTLYKGGLTEEGGAYTFDMVSAGSYIVHTSMVGFGEAYSAKISSDGKSTLTVPTLTLNEGIQIEQVTVTAKKPFIELKADKMVVNVANSAVNAGQHRIRSIREIAWCNSRQQQ